MILRSLKDVEMVSTQKCFSAFRSTFYQRTLTIYIFALLEHFLLQQCLALCRAIPNVREKIDCSRLSLEEIRIHFGIPSPEAPGKPQVQNNLITFFRVSHHDDLVNLILILQNVKLEDNPLIL
jgi:hypothetical protein